MKSFTIPVYWQMTALLYIEAETLEEAIGKAEDGPLPSEGVEYLESSFTVGSKEEITQWNNEKECYERVEPEMGGRV